MQLQQLLTQERELNKELLQIRSTEPEDRLSELVVAAEDRRLRASYGSLAALSPYRVSKAERSVQERDCGAQEASQGARGSGDGAAGDVQAGTLELGRGAIEDGERGAAKAVETGRGTRRCEGRAGGQRQGRRAGRRAGSGGCVDKRQAALTGAVAQLRRELETETAQSKALLQRKQTQRTGDQPTNAEKLTAELLTDLTGLTITSVEENPSDGIFVTYRCLLTDSRPMTKPGAVRLSVSLRPATALTSQASASVSASTRRPALASSPSSIRATTH